MNPSSKFLILKQFELLADLSESELNMLSNVAVFKRVLKGEHIYHEGDQVQHVYLLEKGSVKLGSNTGEEKLLIKDIVHEQSMFGENVFIENETRLEFAEVLNDAKVFLVPIEFFKNLVHTNGNFAKQVLDLIVKRLRHLEERVQNFVFKSAKDRIFDFIIKTGKNRGIKIGLDECLINHGMSHSEIAFLTDTSRQTVARVLGELKRANLIHFSPRKPNKILIRNLGSVA